MIKAIFFDMGGVLLPLNLPRCIEAYRTVAGFKDVDEYIDPCHQRGFFDELEGGNISFEEFMEECKRHCKPGIDIPTLLWCHRQFFEPPTRETVELVHELAQKYDLFILSNNNPVSMSILYPLFQGAGLPFETSFKKLFLSHEMRVQKPGPEIFSRAIAESGYAPEEILFIDDSPSNIEGAVPFGIRAALYVPGTPLRGLIEKNIIFDQK
jgi:putative hydrolase of the HAD superfamily